MRRVTEPVNQKFERPKDLDLEIQMCCGTCSDKLLVQEYIAWLESQVPHDAMFVAKRQREAVSHNTDKDGLLKLPD